MKDGDVVTACEAACPAQAIVFGDVNDKTSRVAKLKASGAQLRPPDRAADAAAHDVPRGGPQPEPGDARRRLRGGAPWLAARAWRPRPRSSHPSSGPATRSPPSPTRSRASSSRRRRRSAGSSASGSRSRSCMMFLATVTYLLAKGTGIFGVNVPVGLGLRHHQLRLVDRDRPRRDAHLRDPAPAAAAVAHLDQPLRGGDDALRRGLRGHVPDPAHGPPLGGRLLADALPEHDGPLAQLPQPPHLGRVRGLDLRHGLRPLLVRGPHPRPRDAARPGAAPGRQDGSTACWPWAGGARPGTGPTTRRPT